MSTTTICPDPRVHRTRYRFMGRSASGRTYYWQSTERPWGGSRVEQITCQVDWFWSKR